MKRIFLPLLALLCFVSLYAQETDVNFALASQGATATASSGNAAQAIDNNTGTRWESARVDPQWWVLDMGQSRTFNTIQIIWEGAYGKTFTISASADNAVFTPIVEINGQSLSGFPHTQTFEFTETTARYIRFDGTERGTQYGYSFYEFRVYLAGVSVLQSLKVTPDNNVCRVGEFVNLAITAPDQNGKQMEVKPTYTIQPAGAGEVVDGKYYPKQKGKATIIANVDDIVAPEFIVFGYEGENIALNHFHSASGYEGNNTPEKAVDGNDASIWVAHANTGSSAEERTYDAWYVIDLKNAYNLDLISIHFEGACSELYHFDVSKDNQNWDTVYNYVGNTNVWNHTDFWYDQPEKTQAVRYIRFFSTRASTQYGLKVYEIQAYGSLVPDTEKPTITAAELIETSFDKAKVRIQATDNILIAQCQVIDPNNAVNGKYSVDNDILTITGLKPETSYSFTIQAVDGAGNVSDSSVELALQTKKYYAEPQTAAPVPTIDPALVQAIYSDAYTIDPTWSYKEGWGDATVYTAKNIEGDNYTYYTSFNWLGWAASTPIFVQHMEYMHIDIWAANDGRMKVTPIYGGTGLTTDDGKGVFVELVGQQWNHFDIPVTDFKNLDLTSIFQMKYSDGNPELTTFAIDNVYFYRTSVLEDSIAPTDLKATMQAADFFSVTLNCSATDESGFVFLNVYNEDSLLVSAAASSGVAKTIRVPLVPSTTLQLDVVATDLGGNASDTLTVEVATLEGPAAAPTPIHGTDSVISIYSDAYETNTNFRIGGWAQQTVVTTGYLAPGDECYLFTNTDYLGWEINDNKAYNVARTTNMHVDVYALEDCTLEITPISLATPTNKEGTYTMKLTANQWNQFDIPLAVYPAVDFTKFMQIKFFNGNGKQFFIDNVYFWGNQATGIHDVVLPYTDEYMKVMINGHLIIIREGVKYTITGQVIQ
jgi:hypothetical protein